MSMQHFITISNAFAQTWVERTAAVFWQSTVLISAAALLVALLLRRSSPAVRCWVWRILAIKLLTMPFWSWAVPWPGLASIESPVHNESPASQPDPELHEPHVAQALANGASLIEPTDDRTDLAAASSPAAAPPAVRPTWQSGLLAIWCGVVVTQVLRLWVQRRRLAQLLSDARLADAWLSDLAAAMADRLSVRCLPQTLISRADCSPFVCGTLRSKLVLPEGLADRLTRSELEQVLLHELAHIKRRDLVWGWLGEIARMAYFFHPAAYWIAYQARLERELACDQLAMAASGQGPNEYAVTLVQVVSHASEPSVFKTAASVAFDGDRS